MVKTQKSQKQRFLSFSRGFCPYCGVGEAVLSETKTGGYHAKCMNPDCGAENSFTNRRAKEWEKEL